MTLKEELAVFDVVELWAYIVVNHVLKSQNNVWIVEGGKA